jgi:phospholipase A1/A2
MAVKPSIVFATALILLFSNPKYAFAADTNAPTKPQLESIHGNAELELTYRLCIEDALNTKPKDTTIKTLQRDCKAQTQSSGKLNRFELEQETEDLAYVLTPHRQNYILAFTHNSDPNQDPWIGPNNPYTGNRPMENAEAKLQVSLKVPLLKESLFNQGDEIYFAFTLKSFWQVYNEDISAPFRDSNYRPELYYQTPLEIPELEGSVFLRGGIEHESNGRSQLLSRSWNRVFAGVGYLRERWTIYLQAWDRVNEDEKVDDGDPATPPPAKGDDNPDITDYYGHFELIAAYDFDQYQITTLMRNNFATHKGALELGFSFPIYGRLRGYMQYFDGYGESLIDYNHRNQRIGIGILLTDIL